MVWRREASRSRIGTNAVPERELARSPSQPWVGVAARLGAVVTVEDVRSPYRQGVAAHGTSRFLTRYRT